MAEAGGGDRRAQLRERPCRDLVIGRACRAFIACSTCAGVKSLHCMWREGGKWGLLWEGAASKQG